MISSTFEAQNINILSGSPMPTLFYDWWKEKTDNLNIKLPTVSFMDPLLLFLQNENCDIIDREKVLDFLGNNISVMDYLYQAPDVIRKKFGNVGLNLKLFFDPEERGAMGELFLNISTDLDVKAAHKKLEQIDKEWFIPIVGKDIEKFNINLDFI